jgi:hypothetical protein
MNYYAQGGQAHGLKSLTGHEIQTKDGVPSFGIGGWFQKNVAKPVVDTGMQAVKSIQNVPGIKQVSDLSTQAFKPIDQALVGLDKQVGKAIPGGWGTIAQVAASMVPGAQPLAIGLGVANGSGVMRKGGSFNLQGAMIGGATAYATTELGEYLRAAGGAPDAAMLPVSDVTAEQIAGQIANQTGSAVSAAPGSQAAMLAEQAAGMGTAGAQNVASSLTAPTNSFGSNLLAGNLKTAAGQAFQPIIDAGTSAYNSGANFLDQATTGSTYTNALSDFGKGASNTGKGIANVFTGNIDPAAAAAVKSGATMAPLMSTAGTIYGTMNLIDQEAQLDYLKQQKAAGNIAQAEYDKAVAEIARQRDYASNVVKENPFSTNPSRDTSIGETYYGRSGDADTLYSRLTGGEKLYAVGGSIDDESGMDEARGLNQGNLQNGLFGGGIASLAAGGMPPRFLSGGGDGMSDSIKATINGNQEARLADGEFVIPADVVSHLGNGSSKAGAKQLYSMMDKVRTARTGRKSQGKQINPRKYLAA